MLNEQSRRFDFQFFAPRDAAPERIASSMLTNGTINLWKKNLGHVPDEVWLETAAEVLVLADNALTKVSPEIRALRALRTLDLGHNQIAELPEAIGDLTALSDFLYLHDNRLASLPASFGQLKMLRYLNISDNQFSVFPECITHMRGLVELRITDNQLSSLPESIADLPRLRELHLGNNQLLTLPSSIGVLSELRQIDLRGNPIETLPASLASLPRLEKLDLRWVNTLKVPEWFSAIEDRGCLVYR
jgi:Leucine-rich repeat (LRR) protein